MPTVFTSWKQIANYLGKGVRTVQRWEQEYDLPIRRTKMEDAHVILSTKEDLDAWVQSRPIQKSELKRLRERVKELEAENDILRRELMTNRFACR